MPVFCYRHYVQDGGRFPSDMFEDLGMTSSDLSPKKAGMLTYVALLGGIVAMRAANFIFQT